MTPEQLERLYDKRANAVEQLRSLSEEAEAEGRDFTSEEQEKYDRIDGDVDSYTRRIKRAERELGFDPNESVRGPQLRGEADEDGELRILAVEEREHPLASGEYREAFVEGYLRNRKLSDHGRRALSVGVDADGGYTVPDEFFRKLVEEQREFGVIRELATVVTTRDNGQLTIPTVAGHQAAAVWTTEATAYDEDADTFGQKTLDDHKATRLTRTSRELAADSAFDIEAYIQRAIAEAFALAENPAFLAGDGIGKPTGFESAVTQTHTGAAGQVTSIISDDLIDVVHTLPRAYRRRAVWLMNDLTVAAVRKLKDTNEQYLWQPGLQAGQPDTLLGRPVETDPDVPVMAASEKSIYFADFSGYWIRDVQALRIQRLIERYAELGQIGFVADKRVDGKCIEPYKFAAYVNPAA